MPVFAQVSDIHIDSGARSVERTRLVMEYLDALPGDLDAVLVTGDIADHGLDAEYESVRELTKSRHPVLICPGNHDDREAFRRSLLGVEASLEPVNAVLRTPEHRVDRLQGRLDPQQAAAERLAVVVVAGADQHRVQ